MILKLGHSMNQISGYLELNDRIYKISSYKDIQAFLLKLDKSTCAISEEELDKLCSLTIEKWQIDDCNVEYGGSPLVLHQLTWWRIYNYRIKEGTVAIQNDAFYTRTRNGGPNICSLNSIYMPNTIKIVGRSAFYALSTLSHIKFSDNLIKICDRAFCECKLLNKINLPESLKIIESYAFQATGIEEIEIPSSVIRIGSGAFSYCEKLKIIIFNGQPQEIGSDILNGCNSLERIEIPVGSIDYFVDRFYPLDKDLFVEK